MNDFKYGEKYVRPAILHGLIWVPVLDPVSHADPELGQSHKHFHVDERFMSDKELKQSGFSVIGVIPTIPDEDMNGEILKVEQREFVCYRTYSKLQKSSSVAFLMDWVRDKLVKQNYRLGQDKKCPHKGFDLSEIKGRNGCVKCPLHGLTFNSKCGTIQ